MYTKKRKCNEFLAIKERIIGIIPTNNSKIQANLPINLGSEP